MIIEAIAMDEITQGEYIGSGWDHSEKKGTWDKEKLDYEEFSFW